MKFLEASYQFHELPDPYDKLGVLKYLEKIGRVCYKSEDKITDESCVKFIQGIRNRKHWAVLEHYIFVMEVPGWIYDDIARLVYHVNTSNPDLAEKIRFIHVSECDDGKKLVSGSATAFNYLWACKYIRENPNSGVNSICIRLLDMYPELMYVPDGVDPYEPDAIKLSSATIRFLSRTEVEGLPVGQRLIHDWMSVRIVTDRGVTHELVRHRPFSFAQESTRYVNYGNKGCQFLIPCWFSDEDKSVLKNGGWIDSDVQKLSPTAQMWTQAMYNAANSYQSLVNNDWVPQMGRSVLPNSTKTEIVMTGNMNEWVHFFNMRVPKAAHPQMREVAVPMLKECIGNKPELFAAQYKLLEE
jgi:thymidylate synthase (FAD)